MDNHDEFDDNEEPSDMEQVNRYLEGRFPGVVEEHNETREGDIWEMSEDDWDDLDFSDNDEVLDRD